MRKSNSFRRIANETAVFGVARRFRTASGTLRASRLESDLFVDNPFNHG